MKNTWILLLGLLILIFSLVLDMLGMNTKEGFGLVQILGTVIGAVLIIYGIVMMRKGKK
jgi:hypothetical protein